MKIAISGAQCSGKTTLLNELKNDEAFKDYHFFDSFSNKIVKNNEHSENTTINTQLQMLYYSLSNLENTYENEIHDRCILDVFIYSQASNIYNIFSDKEIIKLDLFKLALEKMLNYFDIIFILNAKNIPFENSNTRSINLKHRELVNELFYDFAFEIIDNDNFKSKIITLNPQERLKSVKKYCLKKEV